MKNNKLKPCPFCGSDNIVIYDKSFNSGPYYDIFAEIVKRLYVLLMKAKQKKVR